jgi:hypothetical protein
MGEHKKNKPTPNKLIKEGNDPDPVPVTVKESQEPKQLDNDLNIGDNEFKEEEKIVENLEDMPLPLGDIDPVEMKVEREEGERAEDHIHKLKEQGKTLGETQEEQKPISDEVFRKDELTGEVKKSGRISYSEMLRNRRKSIKRN